jgi:hypothetical protein
LFEFLTPPLLCFGLGFVLALLAYQIGEFDPPPPHWSTQAITWLPILLSAGFVVGALAIGALRYLVLAGTQMQAAGMLP